uniref:Uncharacterized protein n=1 Tax=Anopheles culicifacies TaxID=139723 RepID=A0A182M806_9DIPT
MSVEMKKGLPGASWCTYLRDHILGTVLELVVRILEPVRSVLVLVLEVHSALVLELEVRSALVLEQVPEQSSVLELEPEQSTVLELEQEQSSVLELVLGQSSVLELVLGQSSVLELVLEQSSVLEQELEQSSVLEQERRSALGLVQGKTRPQLRDTLLVAVVDDDNATLDVFRDRTETDHHPAGCWSFCYQPATGHCPNNSCQAAMRYTITPPALR